MSADLNDTPPASPVREVEPLLKQSDEALALVPSKSALLITAQAGDKYATRYITKELLEKCTGSSDLASATIFELRLPAGEKIRRFEKLELIPNVTSFTFTHQRLKKLENMAPLSKLAHLNLRANQLEKLDGLPVLSHLTHLDVSRNRLDSLPQNLSRLCPSLLDVNLHGNQIQLLAKLQPLRQCKNLTALDVSGNPVSQAASYRSFLVWNTPAVGQLDGESVANEERHEANARWQREELAARDDAIRQLEKQVKDQEAELDNREAVVKMRDHELEVMKEQVKARDKKTAKAEQQRDDANKLAESRANHLNEVLLDWVMVKDALGILLLELESTEIDHMLTASIREVFVKASAVSSHGSFGNTTAAQVTERVVQLEKMVVRKHDTSQEVAEATRHLEAQLRESASRVAELQRDLDEANRQNDNSIVDFKAKAAEHEGAEAVLREELSALQRRLQDAESESRSHSDTIEGLQEKLRLAEREVGDLREKAASRAGEEEEAEYVRELTRSRQDIVALEEQLQDAQEADTRAAEALVEKEEETKAIQDERDQALLKAAEFEMKLKESTRRCGKLQQDVHNLEQEMAILEQEKALGSAAVAATGAELDGEVAALEREVASLRAQVIEGNEELDKQRAENHELKQQLLSQADSEFISTPRRNIMPAYNNNQHRLQEVETQLENTLAKLEDVEDELELERQKAGALHARLLRAESEAGELREHYASAVARLESSGGSREKLAATERETASLRQQLAARKEEESRHVAARQQLEHELAATRQLNQELMNDSINSNQEAMAHETELLKASQQESARLTAVIEQLKEKTQPDRANLAAEEELSDLRTQAAMASIKDAKIAALERESHVSEAREAALFGTLQEVACAAASMKAPASACRAAVRGEDGAGGGTTDEASAGAAPLPAAKDAWAAGLREAVLPCVGDARAALLDAAEVLRQKSAALAEARDQIGELRGKVAEADRLAAGNARRVQALDAANTSLQDDLAGADAKARGVSQAERKRREAEDKLVQATEELAEKDREIDGLRRRIRPLQSSERSLNEELREKEAEIEDLKKQQQQQAVRRGSDAGSKECRIAELQAEVAELRRHLDTSRSSQQKTAGRDTSVASFGVDTTSHQEAADSELLREKDAAITLLRSELDAVRLQLRGDHFREEISRIELVVRGMAREASSSEAFQQQSDRLAEVERALANLHHDHPRPSRSTPALDTHAELAEELYNCRASLRTTEAQLRRAEESLAGEKRVTRNQAADLESASNRADDVEQELEALRKAKAATERRLHEAQDAVSKEQQQKREAQQKCYKLQTALTELELEKAERETAHLGSKQKIALLESDVAVLNRSTASLNKRLATADVELAATLGSSPKLTNHNSKLEHLQSELAAAEATIAHLTRHTRSTAEFSSTTSSDSYTAITGNRHGKHGKHSSSRSRQIAELESNLETASATISLLTANIEAQKNAARDAEKVPHLERELASAHRRIVALQAELDNAAAVKRGLEADLHGTRAKVQITEAELAESRERQKALHAELKAATASDARLLLHSRQPSADSLCPPHDDHTENRGASRLRRPSDGAAAATPPQKPAAAWLSGEADGAAARHNKHGSLAAENEELRRRLDTTVPALRTLLHAQANAFDADVVSGEAVDFAPDAGPRHASQARGLANAREVLACYGTAPTQPQYAQDEIAGVSAAGLLVSKSLARLQETANEASVSSLATQLELERNVSARLQKQLAAAGAEADAAKAALRQQQALADDAASQLSRQQRQAAAEAADLQSGVAAANDRVLAEAQRALAAEAAGRRLRDENARLAADRRAATDVHQRELDAVQRSAKELRKQLSALGSKYEAQVEQLKADMKPLADRCLGLARDTSDTAERLKECQQALQSKEQRISDLTRAVTESERELQLTQRRCSDDVRELKSELAAVRVQLSEATDGLRHAKSKEFASEEASREAKERLESLHHETARLESELLASQSRVNLLKSDLGSFAEQLARTETRAQKAEVNGVTVGAELSAAMTENGSLREAEGRLKRELTRKNDELAAMSRQTSQLTEELQRKGADMLDLAQKLRAKGEECDGLAIRVGDLSAEMQLAETTKSEDLAAARRSDAQKSARIALLEADADKNSAERTASARKDDEISSLRAALLKSSRRERELELTLSRLEAELEEATHQATHRGVEIKKLQARGAASPQPDAGEAQRCRDTVQRQAADLAAANSAVRTLRADKDDLLRRVAELEAADRIAGSQDQSRYDEVQGLRAEVDQLTAALRQQALERDASARRAQEAYADSPGRRSDGDRLSAELASLEEIKGAKQQRLHELDLHESALLQRVNNLQAREVALAQRGKSRRDDSPTAEYPRLFNVVSAVADGSEREAASGEVHGLPSATRKSSVAKRASRTPLAATKPKVNANRKEEHILVPREYLESVLATTHSARHFWERKHREQQRPATHN